MNPASRQDVQNIVEIAKNRTLDRIPTKSEFVQLFDNVRTLINLHQQSQQLLKQSEYQRSQLTRRAVALETRVVALETEIKTTQYMISRLTERQPQQMVVPAQPGEQSPQAQPVQQQYAYRPN